ncbi:MAG: hypothetical protein AAB458_01310 [Patescibacteria group bacterium]
MAQTQQVQKPPFPQIGEVFELTSNSELSGIWMIRHLEKPHDPSKWRFTGTNIPEGMTKRFKLVEFGYQPSFAAVVKMYTKHGKIPEGVWMQSFYEIFNKGDYYLGYLRGNIGVPDASWERAESVHYMIGVIRGEVCFPAIGQFGHWMFCSVDRHFLGDWCWLVEAE